MNNIGMIIRLYELGYDEMETSILIEDMQVEANIIIRFSLKRSELTNHMNGDLEKAVIMQYLKEDR